MHTYNALLYTERKNRGLSRRKMTKLFKMSLFNYSMVEKGYFKPTKKQVERISNVLEIDYKEYLIGEPSYPSELPEKKRNVLVAFFYKVVGHIVFKIIFGILAGASVGFMISGFIINNNINSNMRSYFPNEYLQFVDNLKENGSIHISATGELFAPEYYHYEKDTDNKTSKYISIVGSNKDQAVSTIHITTVYRDEKSRLAYTIIGYSSGIQETHYINVRYTEYESAISVTASYYDFKARSILLTDEKGSSHIFYDDDERYALYNSLLSSKFDVYENDIDQLISEKDPTFAPESTNKLDALLNLRQEGENKIITPQFYAFLGRYFGIILSGINLFILAYAFLYGTTKKGEKVYVETKLDVQVDEVHRMKSDMKFAPFIPETLLEIIGIILVFIGSFRLVFYVGSFITGNSNDVIGTSTGSELMQTFMVGMFLLYFIDFDIFLDDKRTIRNIVLYSIVFFCLYGLENLLYRVLNNDSIMGDMMSRVVMPNMFGTIACYYLIMLFLFFKPKFIKKDYQLIIFRCLSIIPTAIIFVSSFLFHGYNVLFDADWPIELKNLFNGEKIPFSMLAVTYLYSLYFMRFYFVHKYGQDRAKTFFNGNKFLWIKNIMVCLIIAIIGIIELSLKDNAIAHKLGLGMYWNILFLIPLLLFYHPHKGPRNLPLDWTTLFFYILSISLSYIAVILMVLVRLAS